MPLLEDEPEEEDLADFVSEVLPVDFVPDFAFVADVPDSDEEDLLLFEEEPELNDPDVPDPVLPMLEELMSEPLWLEDPDDRPLDMLPDWLED